MTASGGPSSHTRLLWKLRRVYIAHVSTRVCTDVRRVRWCSLPELPRLDCPGEPPLRRGVREGAGILEGGGVKETGNDGGPRDRAGLHTQ